MLPATTLPPFSAHPVAGKYRRYVNPALIELLNVLGYGRVFVRAKDVWVWDDRGREYLDCLASFGALNLGHNHPRLTARLQDFLRTDAPNYFHVGPSPYTAELAELLAARAAPLEVSLYSSSGAEAVEAGMKLACAATGRHGFVFCHGGYHGTNLGTLAVMGSAARRAPFEPLLANAVGVPFGDLDRLEQALAAREVAGFLVEPLQAEAGVQLPPADYLRRAQALCAKFGTLLILDEVQTGLGRCGTLFAYEREGLVPDVLVLAKSLGGGIASIGATLTTRAIHGKAYGPMDRFDWHSSTFGGNAFACVAAIETLRILHDEKLAQNAGARGAQLLAGLKRRLTGHPFIKDIRGRGLLVAIDIGPTEEGWTNRLAPALVALAAKKVFGQWIALKLLESGIICQPAAQRWDVLKVEPPLTIQAPHIERFIETVGAIFDEYHSLVKLLADVGKRLAKLA